MTIRAVGWPVALVALALLGVAAVSRRLSESPVTPTMLFVGFGLLIGPEALDRIDVPSTSSAVRTLAEATLALVLFADSSRIDLRHLRRGADVPVRLLGIGLPLTIALGSAIAAVVFGQLSVEEAVVLGVALAPTDAALGQAVVVDPRVPQRIRQGLNIESGLNDGICVPLLFLAVAAADVHADITEGHRAITIVMIASACIALVLGLNAGGPASLLAVMLFFYGLTVPADSGALTAGMAASATAGHRGATMALHSTVGFGLSAVGAWGTGVALDLGGGPQSGRGWFLAFVVLAIGISLGPIALWWSRNAARGRVMAK